MYSSPLNNANPPRQHDELYEIMHDAVQATGAQIQYSANVVSIDPSKREVVLDSGERFAGDVIVGADGEHGLSRELVAGRPIRGTPTGLALYEYVFLDLGRNYIHQLVRSAVIGNDIVLDLLGRDLFKDVSTRLSLNVWQNQLS